MAVKSQKGGKYVAGDNEISNVAEAASAQSILSGQNGSPSENQDGASGVTELAPDNLLKANARKDDSKKDSENKYDVFLEMIRNKLISDFSSGIFRSSLENELNKMEPLKIDAERMSVIEEILVQIYLLSDSEKLLLYLKLPSSLNSTADPLTQPLNPLGNRQEIQQAIVWIKTHLEEDKEKSLPKQDVYDQYLKYCQNGSMKALSTADFGKVMKQLYPDIRPRRLGTRGNSRYCYSGMRNTVRLATPSLPKSLHESSAASSSGKNDSGAVAVGTGKTKGENPNKKSKKSSGGSKTPSATLVRYQAPKDSTLSHIDDSTIEKEAAVNPAVKENLANELDTVSENQDNLSQSFSDNKHELGNNLPNSSDNVDKAAKDGTIFDKITLEMLNKIALPNKEFNDKVMHETGKTNEVNSTQNPEPVKFQPNKFFVTKLPLRIINRIIPITALKRLNNPKFSRIQVGISASRSQRLGVRRNRSLPQSQRYRRRHYIPIRPKPVNGGKYWLHVHLGLRSKSSCKDAPDLPDIEEEIVRYFRHLEDTELLGVVGGAIVDELLKLEKISEKILNGCKSIRGARSQSCLENKSGTLASAGNAVQGELPQRSQSSVECPAEPNGTFEKQGNIEYISNGHLLLSKMENMIDINTEELSTQNNAVNDGRQENVSVSPSTNFCHFIPISPGVRTPMISPAASPYLSPQNAQTVPNNTFVPPNNSFLSPNNGFVASNSNFSPSGNDFMSPNNSFSPSNNILPPTNNFSPSNNVLPPTNNFLPPANNFLLPNNSFIVSSDVMPPRNNFLIPNNSFQPSNNVIPPTNNFFIPSGNFLPSNNALPSNTSFISPNHTFVPQNNANLNRFNIIKPGILGGGFNVRNDAIPEQTFPKVMPDNRPRSSSANFYYLGAQGNPPEILNFDHFLPNEVNFSEATMENISANTNSDFPNLSEEIDELMVSQPNFEEARVNNSRSQSEPVNTMTTSGMWFPVENICTNNDGPFGQYGKGSATNQLVPDEYSFEPITDCQTMETFTENETFPNLSLDDLAVDSDDITDQMYSESFVSEPSNVNFQDNSLNAFSDKIDDDNVFESSFPNESMNPYFNASRVQGNPLLKRPADVDFFDNLFDDTETPKDPTVEAPVGMDEYQNYNEHPASNFSPYRENIDNQLNKYLGLN